MKIRNGFVSNSSSSSFIVAADNPVITLSIEIDLSKHASKIFVPNVDTEKDVWDYFEDNWYIDDYNRPYAEECVKQLKAGKTVLLGSFSDEGYDYKQVFLCNNGLEGLANESVKIIYNEAGY